MTTVTVNIGKGLTMDVDTARLNADVRSHIEYIGLRNVLMDAHASATRDEHGADYVSVAANMAQKKLNALYAGELRVAGTRESDPVRAMAITLAIGTIDAALRKAGRKVSSVELKVKKAKAVEMLAKDASYMERAKAAIAADSVTSDDVLAGL